MRACVCASDRREGEREGERAGERMGEKAKGEGERRWRLTPVDDPHGWFFLRGCACGVVWLGVE